MRTWFHWCSLSLAVAAANFAAESAGQSLHKSIDREVARLAGGEVSPVCDDAEFVRRIYLDLAGRIPTPQEAREFLGDKAAAKRAALIDRLLAGADFPRRLEEFLTATLLERRADSKVPDEQWEAYMRQSIADNKPWNELIGELLFTESPAGKHSPADKFWLVAGREDFHQRTQDVARLLLGRNIMCAQCHDHPTVEDYTQADYFGLFTFLQETPDKAAAEFESVFVPGKKSTGPRLPGGRPVEIPKVDSSDKAAAETWRPRRLLAAQLPGAETPLFARNAVNRFWCLMMGRGLVHPLDMLHRGNPASHPELLDELAAAFSASGYDVRQLLRELALSDTYQRSSLLPAGAAPEDVAPESYRAALPKPLTAEQMAWSVMQATGNLAALQAAAPEKSSFTYKDYINGLLDAPPQNGADAMKLFVGVFSNPPGEPETEFNPAVGHSLFLMNEPMILEWLRPRPGNLLDRVVKLSDAEQAVGELFISVLSRPPTAEELGEFKSYLERNGGRRSEALGELAWALLTTAEFRCNH